MNDSVIPFAFVLYFVFYVDKSAWNDAGFSFDDDGHVRK